MSGTCGLEKPAASTTQRQASSGASLPPGPRTSSSYSWRRRSFLWTLDAALRIAVTSAPVRMFSFQICASLSAYAASTSAFG